MFDRFLYKISEFNKAHSEMSEVTSLEKETHLKFSILCSVHVVFGFTKGEESLINSDVLVLRFPVLIWS